jgi:hypothetical protein
MQQRSGSRSCAKSTVAPEGTSETGRRDVGMFQHPIAECWMVKNYGAGFPCPAGDGSLLKIAEHRGGDWFVLHGASPLCRTPTTDTIHAVPSRRLQT